jgi:hypothetical protein
MNTVMVIKVFCHLHSVITNSVVNEHSVITNIILSQIAFISKQVNPVITNPGYNELNGRSRAVRYNRVSLYNQT